MSNLVFWMMLAGGAIALFKGKKKPHSNGGFEIVETVTIRRDAEPRWVKWLAWIIFFFVLSAIMFSGDDKPQQQAQPPDYHRTAYAVGAATPGARL